MKMEHFTACMEKVAPLAYAESWDNCGMLIEPEQRDITKVLVALDCTLETAREAVAERVQLVLCHHPLFLDPIRRISPTDPATAAAWLLIRHGIGMYAAHTCLDRAPGGVNDVLARRLGLTRVRPLPEREGDMPGMGRMGMLEQPCRLGDFARSIQETLRTSVRITGEPKRQIHSAAVLGGAGGDFLYEAATAGADVFVTGEIKHHHALAARELGLCVVEAGHYETERPVLEALIASLQCAVKGIQYNDNLNFVMSKSQRAPLVGV